MGFTDWLESLTPIFNVVRLLAGIGLVTVLLSYLKRIAERRRWRNFKVSVHERIDRLIELENRHPKDLSEDEWKSACERMLIDSNFTPLEVEQLLEVAVVAARGIAADRVFM